MSDREIGKAEEIIWEYPKGLLNWYSFRKDSRILCITEEENGIVEFLRSNCQGLEVLGQEAALGAFFLDKNRGTFDNIVAINVIEKLENPVSAMAAWKSLLSPKGRMLLGMDNRLGLRYFCGDRDPFSNRNFDGIENYRRVLPQDRKYLKGRSYTAAEIREMLEAAGILSYKFYTVLPALDCPQLIYAQDTLPMEELSGRYYPMYHYPDTVFIEEEYLYTDMIKNGLFHSMANAYLIECSLDSTFENAKHITLSMDRGKNNALATVIRDNGTVEKKVLYREGRSKLQCLKENADDLKKHGLKVVEAEIIGDSYVMPYMECEGLVNYLQRLFQKDLQSFKEEVDKFRTLILQSSDAVGQEKDDGIILKRGYLDLVPLNCFYQEGEYIFYDQEFFEENYPANAIIYRAIEIIYRGSEEMEKVLPRKFFWKRYRLEEQLEIWQKKTWEFTYQLKNQKELRCFLEKRQCSPETLNTNRQRMNYSAMEYQKIFVDIFQNLEGKKIILFGSGSFAKRFIAQFAINYAIYAIIDNNKEKWGKDLEGIPIYPPEILSKLQHNEMRIIICVKNYIGIVKQLQEMGIKEYCIYDKNVYYPIAKPTLQTECSSLAEKENLSPKKYHVGYIAGVFDLFHIGHLNMFKRAKEQCEYLIVGVVTDEGVRKHKKTEPFIPFGERIEMVRSCKYVDEAVEIPLDFGGTRDAYHMYRFDCQFSGSDYAENPYWLAEKAFLQKQGSDLVFFPYTEGTSSTKIKKMIEKSLL